MLGQEQVRAYAGADFEAPHSMFVDLLRQRLTHLSDSGWALDLGCGPGDIAFRFAAAFQQWHIDGVDGSPAMLELGRAAAEDRLVADRIRFQEAVIPEISPPRPRYDLVFSNSLLHHLNDARDLWAAIVACGGAGASVFVMDLLRPGSSAAAEALVEAYALAEPELLKRDFYHSLLAAYRPDEVDQQLRAAGLTQLRLDVVSDRHFIVWGQL